MFSLRNRHLVAVHQQRDNLVVLLLQRAAALFQTRKLACKFLLVFVCLVDVAAKLGDFPVKLGYLL